MYVKILPEKTFVEILLIENIRLEVNFNQNELFNYSFMILTVFLHFL